MQAKAYAFCPVLMKPFFAMESIMRYKLLRFFIVKEILFTVLETLSLTLSIVY